MISLNWLHKSVDHKTLCLSFFTRPLLGIPQRTAAGKYYASILADDGQEAAAKPTYITAVTGFDLGLSHYLIDNNGGKVANPRHQVLSLIHI